MIVNVVGFCCINFQTNTVVFVACLCLWVFVCILGVLLVLTILLLIDFEITYINVLSIIVYLAVLFVSYCFENTFNTCNDDVCFLECFIWCSFNQQFYRCYVLKGLFILSINNLWWIYNTFINNFRVNKTEIWILVIFLKLILNFFLT